MFNQFEYDVDNTVNCAGKRQGFFDIFLKGASLEVSRIFPNFNRIALIKFALKMRKKEICEKDLENIYENS